MMKITGGCHCGAVRYEATVPDEVLRVDDCNCSMCARSGYLHLIVPHRNVTLIGDPAVGRYRFNTQAAEHIFCAKCGIKSYYQPRSHPGSWSLNWNCVDEPRPEATIIKFDGQNWEASRHTLD